MNNVTIALLSIILCGTAYSQEKTFVVLGKVVDSASRQPLTGASAFCQNTTQGTISNSEGLFYMRLPYGGYDLVVSYTGYEKRVVRISNNQPTDTILFELPKESKAMEEVAVVATNEVADGLAKYGQFFMDNFIGNTPAAGRCIIQNPDTRDFIFSMRQAMEPIHGVAFL